MWFSTITANKLPQIVCIVDAGLKIIETNERELVIEPAIKWAGNPNIIAAVSFSSRKIFIQVV